MLKLAGSLSHSNNFALSCRAWIVATPGPSTFNSPQRRRFLSTTPSDGRRPHTITVLGREYPTDSYTNLTPSILSKLSAGLTNKPGHPLHTLRTLIESHFPSHTHFNASGSGSSSIDSSRDTSLAFLPLVTPAQNFDELSFPPDHPGRAQTDTYYVNRSLLLRTHTSAHEVALFRAGHERWTLTADVFRRDEIDRAHYPVFHQMEGARLFSASRDQAQRAAQVRALEEENAELLEQVRSERIVLEDRTVVDEENPYQPGHDVALAHQVTLNLKYSLSLLLYKLFANVRTDPLEPLRIRWISAYFPFTSPSYEVEVFFGGKWMEILGCGVVQQQTLVNAKVQNKIGWAFGLGLERIAMILFQIPDIRLFWSTDPRFLAQFAPHTIVPFRPYSRFPGTARDVSFWLPFAAASGQEKRSRYHPNDFCDLVREVAGDLAEEVVLFDKYIPAQKERSAKGDFRKESHSYRINFRSMDRSLEGTEINLLTDVIKDRARRQLGVVIR